MRKKISQIKKTLLELNLDALFITNQANVTYLTGFAGLASSKREAFLLITKDSSFLLTFPTYFGMYKDSQSLKVINIPPQIGLSRWLAKFILRNDLKTVGFEKADITVAELEKLQKKTINITWRETEKIVENLRLYKDKKEIASIKKACHIADRAFSSILDKIRKGRTERQIALELEYFIKRYADDVAFPPIVAFGKNAAIPHYLPSNNQQLTINSSVLLDFGAKVDGYCSDMTRVVFWGKPNKKFIKIYNTVLKAQEIALRHLGGGQLVLSEVEGDSPEVEELKDASNSRKASTIDKLAKDFLQSKGYPSYPHGIGHGVGIQVHESPRLRLDSKETLSPGMVFTVEPAIYIEGWGGVRIEDLVVLKEDGVEILTQSTKELTIIK